MLNQYIAQELKCQDQTLKNTVEEYTIGHETRRNYHDRLCQPYWLFVSDTLIQNFRPLDAEDIRFSMEFKPAVQSDPRRGSVVVRPKRLA